MIWSTFPVFQYKNNQKVPVNHSRIHDRNLLTGTKRKHHLPTLTINRRDRHSFCCTDSQHKKARWIWSKNLLTLSAVLLTIVNIKSYSGFSFVTQIVLSTCLSKIDVSGVIYNTRVPLFVRISFTPCNGLLLLYHLLRTARYCMSNIPDRCSIPTAVPIVHRQTNQSYKLLSSWWFHLALFTQQCLHD